MLDYKYLKYKIKYTQLSNGKDNIFNQFITDNRNLYDKLINFYWKIYLYYCNILYIEELEKDLTYEKLNELLEECTIFYNKSEYSFLHNIIQNLTEIKNEQHLFQLLENIRELLLYLTCNQVYKDEDLDVSSKCFILNIIKYLTSSYITDANIDYEKCYKILYIINFWLLSYGNDDNMINLQNKYANILEKKKKIINNEIDNFIKLLKEYINNFSDYSKKIKNDKILELYKKYYDLFIKYYYNVHLINKLRSILYYLNNLYNNIDKNIKNKNEPISYIDSIFDITNKKNTIEQHGGVNISYFDTIVHYLININDGAPMPDFILNGVNDNDDNDYEAICNICYNSLTNQLCYLCKSGHILHLNCLYYTGKEDCWYCRRPIVYSKYFKYEDLKHPLSVEHILYSVIRSDMLTSTQLLSNASNERATGSNSVATIASDRPSSTAIISSDRPNSAATQANRTSITATRPNSTAIRYSYRTNRASITTTRANSTAIRDSDRTNRTSITATRATEVDGRGTIRAYLPREIRFIERNDTILPQDITMLTILTEYYDTIYSYIIYFDDFLNKIIVLLNLMIDRGNNFISHLNGLNLNFTNQLLDYLFDNVDINNQPILEPLRCDSYILSINHVSSIDDFISECISDITTIYRDTMLIYYFIRDNLVRSNIEQINTVEIYERFYCQCIYFYKLLDCIINFTQSIYAPSVQTNQHRARTEARVSNSTSFNLRMQTFEYDTRSLSPTTFSISS